MRGWNEALKRFWEQFGCSVYLEGRVPDGARTPYLIYSAVRGAGQADVQVQATVWTRGDGGEREACLDSIAEMIPPEGVVLGAEGGYLYLLREEPIFQSYCMDKRDPGLLGGRTHLRARFYG